MEELSGAKILMESLRREGANEIFGLPGGAILDVYDALIDSGIRHVLMRHEQCAAHAAEGYARASGRTGVCFSTSGPGATNLVTGIADAHMDSCPMVAVTGQVASHLLGNDAFQEADILAITAPITKHGFQPRSPSEIPGMIKSAFYIANTGRKGPVVVDIPKDVQKKACVPVYPEQVYLRGYKPKMQGHPQQIKKAVELLCASERPLILAGGGVVLSGASAELLALAERFLIPVSTTLMGKGSIPEEHPLAVGMVGMHGRKAANRLVQECDLLLAIGCRFSDRTTGSISGFAPNAKIVHIDIDSAEIGKNVRYELPIVGDAKLVLKEILAMAQEPRLNKAWSEKVTEFAKDCACSLGHDEMPINPKRVIGEINGMLDRSTIVTTEVGQCQMWAAHFLKVMQPRQFISSGGLGTMGFGFPAAIGAKVASPSSQVIDVAGDGSFLMVAQDLATCVEENIPVTVAVMDNGWLGMVKQWQELFYGKRYSATNLGRSPDFVKLAEAFGAKGIRVSRPSEIKEALLAGKDSSVPVVIDIAIDPSEHILPMVKMGSHVGDMMGCRK